MLVVTLVLHCEAVELRARDVIRVLEHESNTSPSRRRTNRMRVTRPIAMTYKQTNNKQKITCD